MPVETDFLLRQTGSVRTSLSGCSSVRLVKLFPDRTLKEHPAGEDEDSYVGLPQGVGWKLWSMASASSPGNKFWR